MKKIYQILFFIFLAFKIVGQVPDNDDCINAINLAVGTEVSGTTKNTTDSELGCSGVLDVWYKFKATSTQHTLIVTPVSAQNYVFVAVASGSSCNNLSCDIFNRNYDYNQPVKILLDNLTKETDYYIKLSSQYGSSGYDFKLVVHDPSVLCQNVKTVTCSNPQNLNVAGTGAFLSVGCTDGSENSDNNGKELIYKFTPSVDGNYLIQLTAADGNRVSYYLKKVTSNCSSTGWLCLGNIGSLDDIVDVDGNGSALALDNLIACQEYYLLLDAPTTNTVNQTFKIVNSFSGDCSGLDCTTLISPISGSSNVSTKPNFEWTPVVNALGYRLTIGITPNGGEILDNVDIGNVSTYTPGSSLPINSTIYLKILPYSCGNNSPSCDLTTVFQTQNPNAPSNDNCDNARTITVLPNGTTNCTGGLLNQTTAGATPTTTGGLTSCVTNQDDIYYKFTTTVAGNYTVRFCNVTAAYGTLGSSVGFSDLIDCSTRRLYCGGSTISNGSASIVMENLAANTTYLFAVWSPGENNALNFDVSVIAPAILSPPSNDECSGAIAFPTIVPNPNLLVPADGVCSIVTVQTEGSTVSNTTPCIASEGDVWYKFTMPQGNYVLKYRIVATQNKIQVYSGTCGNLTPITDCLSNAVGFLNSLSSGQTYYLRVYRVGYQQNNTTEICLQTLLDADDCENAFAFPEIPTDKTCSTLRLSTLNTRPSSIPWCKSNTLDK